MSAMKWNDKLYPLDLEVELEELLEEVSLKSGNGEYLFPGEEGIMRSADLDDLGDCIRLRMELPGVKASSVTITTYEDAIVIDGRWGSALSGKKGQPLQVESRSGAFRRSIEFPTKISSNDADAILESGILTVTLKKSE